MSEERDPSGSAYVKWMLLFLAALLVLIVVLKGDLQKPFLFLFIDLLSYGFTLLMIGFPLLLLLRAVGKWGINFAPEFWVSLRQTIQNILIGASSAGLPEMHPIRKHNRRLLAVAFGVGLVAWVVFFFMGLQDTHTATVLGTGGLLVFSGVLSLPVIWVVYFFLKAFPYQPPPPETAKAAAGAPEKPARKIPRLRLFAASLPVSFVICLLLSLGSGESKGLFVGNGPVIFFGFVLLFSGVVYIFLKRVFYPPPGNPNLASDQSPWEPSAELEAAAAEMEAMRQQHPPGPDDAAARTLEIRGMVKGALAGGCILLGLWLIAILFPGAANHAAQPTGLAGQILRWLVALVVFPGTGAFIGLKRAVESESGESKAYSDFNTAYSKRYMERVLPKLLASAGLTMPSGIPSWESAIAGVQFGGNRRGVPFSLSVISGDLVVTLTLARGLLRGTTEISPNLPDASGTPADGPTSLQAVHLENTQFALAYQVRATDQIAARALLTPAFMERLLALTQRFGPLTVLAQDDRLAVTLQTGGIPFFISTSVREPARKALIRLHADLATLLRVADEVIGLDPGARQQAAGTSGEQP